jgi:hypothetical protein
MRPLPLFNFKYTVRCKQDTSNGLQQVTPAVAQKKKIKNELGE